MAAYQTRPIRFLRLLEFAGWRVKLYSILGSGSEILPEIVHSGCQATETFLTGLPDGGEKVGVIVVHQGADANWVVVRWWVDECIMKYRMFMSPLESVELDDVTNQHMAGCTWEMAVFAHERTAWVDHVMKRNDLNGYLNDQLNVDL